MCYAGSRTLIEMRNRRKSDRQPVLVVPDDLVRAARIRAPAGNEAALDAAQILATRGRTAVPVSPRACAPDGPRSWMFRGGAPKRKDACEIGRSGAAPRSATTTLTGLSAPAARRRRRASTSISHRVPVARTPGNRAFRVGSSPRDRARHSRAARSRLTVGRPSTVTTQRPSSSSIARCSSSISPSPSASGAARRAGQRLPRVQVAAARHLAERQAN